MIDTHRRPGGGGVNANRKMPCRVITSTNFYALNRRSAMTGGNVME
jgi:sulfite exporter TauE/SafE